MFWSKMKSVPMAGGIVVAVSVALLATMPGVRAMDAAKAQEAPKTWEGPLLKPTARESVFEFTRKPTFTNVGKDRYEISFASKGNCDAAVTIEDEKGRIVRHLVYGVLGENAPAPLKQNSLEQAIIWDGKDDTGKYVEAPERCTVRVSLGLKPTFDKLLGWHPKNIVSDRRVGAIAADEDAVYVLTGGERPQLQAYDHEGNYVRTLVPFRADKIDDFKKADLRTIKLLDGYVAYYPGSGPHQGGGPRGNYFDQEFQGEATPTISQRVACRAGRLAFASIGGLTGKVVMRIRTDGALDGDRFYGFHMEAGKYWGKGVTAARGSLSAVSGNHALAASPDGKWLYVTGLTGWVGSFRVHWATLEGGVPVHAVFRVPWDNRDPLDKPFIGNVTSPGSDNDQLNTPTCVATDAKGNVYVADRRNNRIQVFDPEGEYVQTIGIKDPWWLDIDQKTGAIYVIAQKDTGEHRRSWRFHLVKLSPLPKPKTIIDKEFDYGPAANDPVFCIDGWAKRPTVWLTHRHGEIALYEDRGDSLVLKQAFVDEVKKAGHIPFYFSAGFRHILSADWARGKVYLTSVGLWEGNLYSFDPDTGACTVVKVPRAGGDMDEFLIGPDGMAYVRTYKYVLRFDPDTWQKVPFDFGEPVVGTYGFEYGAGARFPWGYVFHVQTGFGIGHNGDLMILGIDSPDYSSIRLTPGVWGAAQKREKKFGGDWTRRYPGRVSGQLLHVWNRRGEERLFDAVKGIPIQSSCVRGDREGNIYLGFGAQKYGEDGKPIYGNSLVKFGKAGGKFIFSEGGMVPLNNPPSRPPEFRHVRAFGADVWTEGQLLWSYGGINTIVTGNCICPQLRFAVDWFGRTFVPESHRCSVAVLDTNGNFVLRLGKYGNADSGRGPDSPIKVGAPEVAIAFCTYLAADTQNGRLYLADAGNNRLISVKLGYHVQETAPVLLRSP